MPRLKIDDDELEEGLDELEYDRSRRDYEKYEGEQPPKDTFLNGYVKALWWTETSNGARMIKVLWIADGNTGETEQYNGLDVWENLVLTGAAKFRWGPFFEHFGLTIRLLKTKAIISDDEDNIGAPITKIGTKFVPGEDCRVGIITKRGKFNGNWKTEVAEWVDEQYDEDEEDEEGVEVDEQYDEDDEEEEPPPPRRTARTASGAASKRASAKSSASKPAGRDSNPKSEEPEDEDDEELEDELEDEELEEEEEPEEDEEEAPPPPKRPTAKKPAAASTSKSSARPKAAASASGKSAPARAQARPARPAAKASARPASTKRRSRAVDDDPPF